MNNRNDFSLSIRHSILGTFFFYIIAAFLIPGALAQESYRKPPQVIVDMLDASPTPSVSIDPSGQMMLLIDRQNMPSIEDMAQPMLRLAGYRINPKTNGPFTTTYNTGLTLKRISDGKEFRIALPDNAKIGTPSWSPDGKRFVFTITTERGIELWVGASQTMRAHRLTEPQINTAGGGGFRGGGAAYRWMPDSRNLICRFVPRMREDPPTRSPIPTGPIVEENKGRISPVRTYQDLLTDPHDEALFDYYMTSELFMVDVIDGSKRLYGEAAVYSSFDPSPDGSSVLVKKVVRPYSYRVTARSFPSVVEIWDIQGQVNHHLVDLPLQDTTPIGGVPTGPRNYQWRPHEKTATLLWVEALDEGNPKKKVENRDKLMMLEAPFKAEPIEVARTEQRFTGLTWFEKSDDCLISEYDRDMRWTRTWRRNLGLPDSKPRLVWDRSVQDRYGDPGRPVMMTNRAGKRVAILRNGNMFLSGNGSSPQGDRPFLDRMNLLTLVKDRMWQSKEGTYERVVDILPGINRIVTSFETPDDPPNYFLHEMASGQTRQLTNFTDPTPELRGIHKELVIYQRDDDVTLSATLYLPADYEQGQRLPLIVWAYPREFNSASTAGQISGSPYRFTRVRGLSHLFFLTQGYAIMDGATMPVIGDPETMNDTFLDQIVASAQAAIDKAVEMGVADRERVGVGGHSYGAFMTANLLANCDLFKAGIARSGAYNRTLTPFGFQSERRTLWEAPMSYFRISPFMHADKINEPILLVHGEMDNNSGTFPLQSRRMFHALKGHGATVRLVMLPFESHGYRARESVMHVQAEMIDWFDTHVKNSPAEHYEPERPPAGGNE